MRGHIHGILWALLASFAFASMGVVLKATHQQFTFHAAELVFWRTMPALLLLGGLAYQQKKRFVTPNWRRHIGRSVAGTVSMMLYFYAITLLPLSVAVSISYSSSVFLALWSWLLLREPVTRKTAFVLALGLLGVVVLLQPEWQGQPWWGMGAAIASAALAGLAYFQLRELGQLGEPAWRTVFYMSLIATLISALGSSILGWHRVNLSALPYLFGLSALALVGQMALTQAYAVGRKETVSVLSYLTVAFSTWWAFFVFDEVLATVQYGGMLLIVLSGTISALVKK